MHLVVLENKALCGACKGRCCKNSPGMYIPSDFGGTEDEIYTSLKERWEQGTIKFHKGVPTPLGEWPKGCVHLTEAGCALGDKRPTQCKGLNPILRTTLEEVSQTVAALGCEMSVGLDDVDIYPMWKNSLAFQMFNLDRGVAY